MVLALPAEARLHNESYSLPLLRRRLPGRFIPGVYFAQEELIELAAPPSHFSVARSSLTVHATRLACSSYRPYGGVSSSHLRGRGSQPQMPPHHFPPFTTVFKHYQLNLTLSQQHSPCLEPWTAAGRAGYAGRYTAKYLLHSKPFG